MSTAGWADVGMPASAIEALSGFDAVTIERVGSALSRYRANIEAERARLSNTEARAQADAIAATIRATLERMANLDPTVEERADEIWLERGEWMKERAGPSEVWTTDVVPVLQRFAGLFEHTAAQIPPKKRGRAAKNPRKLLLQTWESIFRSHQWITAAQAELLATTIANACGISIPNDERNRRRASGRK